MGDVQAWVEALRAFYGQYGYPVVFLGALAENTALLGLVLPGGTLALLGGVYAREGTLSLAAVIAFAWIGTTLGYSLDYAVGRYVLGRYAGAWGASRLGRRLRLAGRLRLARAFLWKHGGKAILLSHAIGHVRSFVALTAGLSGMRFARFVGFELVAALLWSSAYCLLGYAVAAEWDRVQALVERAGWALAAVLVLAYLVWRFLLRGRMRRRGGTRARAKAARRLSARRSLRPR